MASVNQIISRMIRAANARDQKELIEKAGLSDGLPSKWKKRGKVSGDAIVDVCLQFGVSVQWLVLGKGPMRWTDGGQHPCVAEKPSDYGGFPEELIVLWENSDTRGKEMALFALKSSASNPEGTGREGSALSNET